MNNQHLRQLRLRKFRSHENLDLKFDSNFIFFSGANGIGKTNILEAISLFSPGRGLRFANIDELRSNSGSGNWNVFSVFEVERELMEIEIGLDDSNKKAVRVDGKKKPLIYIGTILKIIWLTPVMDRLWTGSSYERRRFLDRMVMNFFPDHPRDCLLYEQALRHRNQLFRDNHNDDAWFLAIEKQLAQIGYKIDSNRRKVIDILVKTYRSIGKAAFFPYLEMNLSPSKILNAEELTGVSLTESMAMYPAASVSGWYFAHPSSKYFGIGKIEKDQIVDYAKRKGESVQFIEKWLGPNLNY